MTAQTALTQTEIAGPMTLRGSGEQAAIYIRQLIFQGELRPGTRLPQDTIAKTLDIRTNLYDLFPSISVRFNDQAPKDQYPVNQRTAAVDKDNY